MCVCISWGQLGGRQRLFSWPLCFTEYHWWRLTGKTQTHYAICKVVHTVVEQGSCISVVAEKPKKVCCLLLFWKMNFWGVRCVLCFIVIVTPDLSSHVENHLQQKCLKLPQFQQHTDILSSITGSYTIAIGYSKCSNILRSWCTKSKTMLLITCKFQWWLS